MSLPANNPPTPPSRSELEKKVEEVLDKCVSPRLTVPLVSKPEALKLFTTLIQDSIRESLERVNRKCGHFYGQTNIPSEPEKVQSAESVIQEELDRFDKPNE